VTSFLVESVPSSSPPTTARSSSNIIALPIKGCYYDNKVDNDDGSRGAYAVFGGASTIAARKTLMGKGSSLHMRQGDGDGTNTAADTVSIGSVAFLIPSKDPGQIRTSSDLLLRKYLTRHRLLSSVV